MRVHPLVHPDENLGGFSAHELTAVVVGPPGCAYNNGGSMTSWGFSIFSIAGPNRTGRQWLVLHTHHPPRTRCFVTSICVLRTLIFFGAQSRFKAPSVAEEFRIYVAQVVQEFRDGKRDVVNFPPDLGNTERKYIHNIAAKAGLKSKSSG